MPTSGNRPITTGPFGHSDWRGWGEGMTEGVFHLEACLWSTLPAFFGDSGATVGRPGPMRHEVVWPQSRVEGGVA